MSNNLNLGDHFIVGLKGLKIEAKEREQLSKLSPLGIIIFAHNLSDSEQWPQDLLELINDAQEIIGREKLIVSIDHEGGKVHRLKSPSTCFPSGNCWGSSAGAVGEAMAKELSSLGINLNFAPVLDIHSEPENPVIGVRALGEDPETVERSAIEFLDAMESSGVLGCGKHFPGHGATLTDSHLELPVLNISKTEMAQRELLPFRSLIAHGIKMIMTAHVLYPKLDPDYPATLSKKILHDLLREELGFKGVVISDALEMKAMNQDSQVKNAELALSAGVDILLLAQSENNSPAEDALKVANGLLGTSSPSVKIENLQESKKRIKLLEKKLPNNSAGEQKNNLGCESHQNLCARISET